MSNTYQPESLHPYIMNDRLKKATGSGGISNIPIASADTVGGIKIGGSANPITITGSGNASVRKATSELLGVVKAGDGISVDANGAISVAGISYAGSSNKTADKWVDGKDIYLRSYVFDNTIDLSSTTTELMDYPADFDTIVDAAVQGSSAVNSSVMLFKQNNKLCAIVSGAFGADSLWVKFTKPTI